MRGWTIQHAAWWEAANGKTLRARWSNVHPDDAKVYRELLARLRDRGLRCWNAAPIWLWTVYSDRTRKPDLRCGGHLPRGTKAVRIELEYPPGLAVYTCFQRWCMFMGDVWNNAESPNLKAGLDKLLLNENEVYRQRPHNNPWANNGVLQVQAILPYIEPSWIRTVKPFTAR